MERDVSDYIIEVWFTRNGNRECEKYRNLQAQAAVWKTMRKYKKQIIDIATVTYPVNNRSSIPKPPPGFKFTSFRVNRKKNRFGNLVAGKAEIGGEFEL